MALPMTYARRKRLRDDGGHQKVLRSSPFGQKLLTQLFQRFSAMEALFAYDDKITPTVVQLLREETGQQALARGREFSDEFHAWWYNELPNTSEEEHDFRLSALEVYCQIGLQKAQAADRKSSYTRTFSPVYIEPKIIEIINTINGRMLEDGFGFQFENGQLIELTSQFAHQEVVEPALAILSQPIFDAANAEFRDAFDEFKSRRYDDCIADCGNAFESVIKVIAAQKGWDDVSKDDAAAKLIDALYRHELIPVWMQEQMKGLKMMLQGTPTVRNKEASHGAGETARQVEKHLAAYQMHQTAAAIIFLAEQANLA